jgi:hypothetical protein
MKTFALALVMLGFVTASALAETCNKQHLQEDVSRCIKNKDNVGHDRVVSGATSGDADKLDAGFVACQHGRVEPIANWSACSVDDRLDAARHVLGLSLMADTANKQLNGLLHAHQERYPDD